MKTYTCTLPGLLLYTYFIVSYGHSQSVSSSYVENYTPELYTVQRYWIQKPRSVGYPRYNQVPQKAVCTPSSTWSATKNRVAKQPACTYTAQYWKTNPWPVNYLGAVPPPTVCTPYPATPNYVTPVTPNIINAQSMVSPVIPARQFIQQPTILTGYTTPIVTPIVLNAKPMLTFRSTVPVTAQQVAVSPNVVLPPDLLPNTATVSVTNYLPTVPSKPLNSVNPSGINPTGYSSITGCLSVPVATLQASSEPLPNSATVSVTNNLPTAVTSKPLNAINPSDINLTGSSSISGSLSLTSATSVNSNLAASVISTTKTTANPSDIIPKNSTGSFSIIGSLNLPVATLEATSEPNMLLKFLPKASLQTKLSLNPSKLMKLLPIPTVKSDKTPKPIRSLGETTDSNDVSKYYNSFNPLTELKTEYESPKPIENYKDNKFPDPNNKMTKQEPSGDPVIDINRNLILRPENYVYPKIPEHKIIHACLAGYDSEIFDIMNDIKTTTGDEIFVHFYLFDKCRFNHLSSHMTNLKVLQEKMSKYHHYICLEKNYVESYDDKKDCWYIEKLIIIPSFKNDFDLLNSNLKIDQFSNICKAPKKNEIDRGYQPLVLEIEEKVKNINADEINELIKNEKAQEVCLFDIKNNYEKGLKDDQLLATVCNQDAKKSKNNVKEDVNLIGKEAKTPDGNEIFLGFDSALNSKLSVGRNLEPTNRRWMNKFANYDVKYTNILGQDIKLPNFGYLNQNLVEVYPENNQYRGYFTEIYMPPYNQNNYGILGQYPIQKSFNEYSVYNAKNSFQNLPVRKDNFYFDIHGDYDVPKNKIYTVNAYDNIQIPYSKPYRFWTQHYTQNPYDVNQNLMQMYDVISNQNNKNVPIFYNAYLHGTTITNGFNVMYDTIISNKPEEKHVRATNLLSTSKVLPEKDKHSCELGKGLNASDYSVLKPSSVKESTSFASAPLEVNILPENNIKYSATELYSTPKLKFKYYTDSDYNSSVKWSKLYTYGGSNNVFPYNFFLQDVKTAHNFIPYRPPEFDFGSQKRTKQNFASSFYIPTPNLKLARDKDQYIKYLGSVTPQSVMFNIIPENVDLQNNKKTKSYITKSLPNGEILNKLGYYTVTSNTPAQKSKIEVPQTNQKIKDVPYRILDKLIVSPKDITEKTLDFNQNGPYANKNYATVIPNNIVTSIASKYKLNTNSNGYKLSKYECTDNYNFVDTAEPLEYNIVISNTPGNKKSEPVTIPYTLRDEIPQKYGAASLPSTTQGYENVLLKPIMLLPTNSFSSTSSFAETEIPISNRPSFEDVNSISNQWSIISQGNWFTKPKLPTSSAANLLTKIKPTSLINFSNNEIPNNDLAYNVMPSTKEVLLSSKYKTVKYAPYAESINLIAPNSNYDITFLNTQPDSYANKGFEIKTDYISPEEKSKGNYYDGESKLSTDNLQLVPIETKYDHKYPSPITSPIPITPTGSPTFKLIQPRYTNVSIELPLKVVNRQPVLRKEIPDDLMITRENIYEKLGFKTKPKEIKPGKIYSLKQSLINDNNEYEIMQSYTLPTDEVSPINRHIEEIKQSHNVQSEYIYPVQYPPKALYNSFISNQPSLKAVQGFYPSPTLDRKDVFTTSRILKDDEPLNVNSGSVTSLPEKEMFDVVKSYSAPTQKLDHNIFVSNQWFDNLALSQDYTISRDYANPKTNVPVNKVITNYFPNSINSQRYDITKPHITVDATSKLVEFYTPNDKQNYTVGESYTTRTTQPNTKPKIAFPDYITNDPWQHKNVGYVAMANQNLVSSPKMPEVFNLNKTILTPKYNKFITASPLPVSRPLNQTGDTVYPEYKTVNPQPNPQNFHTYNMEYDDVTSTNEPKYQNYPYLSPSADKKTELEVIDKYANPQINVKAQELPFASSTTLPQTKYDVVTSNTKPLEEKKRKYNVNYVSITPRIRPQLRSAMSLMINPVTWKEHSNGPSKPIQHNYETIILNTNKPASILMTPNKEEIVDKVESYTAPNILLNHNTNPINKVPNANPNYLTHSNKLPIIKDVFKNQENVDITCCNTTPNIMTEALYLASQNKAKTSDNTMNFGLNVIPSYSKLEDNLQIQYTAGPMKTETFTNFKIPNELEYNFLKGYTNPKNIFKENYVTDKITYPSINAATPVYENDEINLASRLKYEEVKPSYMTKLPNNEELKPIYTKYEPKTKPLMVPDYTKPNSDKYTVVDCSRFKTPERKSYYDTFISNYYPKFKEVKPNHRNYMLSTPPLPKYRKTTPFYANKIPAETKYFEAEQYDAKYVPNTPLHISKFDVVTSYTNPKNSASLKYLGKQFKPTQITQSYQTNASNIKSVPNHEIVTLQTQELKPDFDQYLKNPLFDTVSSNKIPKTNIIQYLVDQHINTPWTQEVPKQNYDIFTSNDDVHLIPTKKPQAVASFPEPFDVVSSYVKPLDYNSPKYTESLLISTLPTGMSATRPSVLVDSNTGLKNEIEPKYTVINPTIPKTEEVRHIYDVSNTQLPKQLFDAKVSNLVPDELAYQELHTKPKNFVKAKYTATQYIPLTSQGEKPVYNTVLLSNKVAKENYLVPLEVTTKPQIKENFQVIPSYTESNKNTWPEIVPAYLPNNSGLENQQFFKSILTNYVPLDSGIKLEIGTNIDQKPQPFVSDNIQTVQNMNTEPNPYTNENIQFYTPDKFYKNICSNSINEFNTTFEDVKQCIASTIASSPELKQNLYDLKDPTEIAFKSIVIAKTAIENDKSETIKTRYEDIDLKVFVVKMKVLKPKLVLVAEEVTVTNFIPLVSVNEKRDQDTIQNIAKEIVGKAYNTEPVIIKEEFSNNLPYVFMNMKREIPNLYDGTAFIWPAVYKYQYYSGNYASTYIKIN